jgi:hypothetical protein
MSDFLFQYHKVYPTTWAYLSSLLMIGLYFKFGRFWSVRNLDLVLLVLLVPGLLLVHAGYELQEVEEVQRLEAQALLESTQADQAPTSEQPVAVTDPGEAIDDRLEEAEVAGPEPTGVDPLAEPDLADSEPLQSEVPTALESPAEETSRTPVTQVRGSEVKRVGFIWLFGAGAMLLVRLLADPNMVRRPLLEPNLSPGGMTFIGISMFVFLMANIIVSQPTPNDLQGGRGADRMLSRESTDGIAGLRRYGPGYPLLHILPTLPTISFVVHDPDSTSESEAEAERFYAYALVAKAMAILSHLAIVLGIIAIGYRHFDNVKMGIGVALIYLMLPYTWIMTGRVDHCLPAALMVWMIMSYRRPVVAGVLLGLSISAVYFPLFLLPLWISFYWQRGILRFLVGLGSSLLVAILSLALVSPSLAEFAANIQGMLGLWRPIMDSTLLQGIWSLGWSPWYRVPILAAFVVMSLTLAFVPAQKNLGTLMSCSAAVMVAVQFWYGHGGGLYIAWYLPLLLMTIFRPNLEDRVALNVLSEGWFPRRRNGQSPTVRQAA